MHLRSCCRDGVERTILVQSMIIIENGRQYIALEVEKHFPRSEYDLPHCENRCEMAFTTHHAYPFSQAYLYMALKM